MEVQEAREEERLRQQGIDRQAHQIEELTRRLQQVEEQKNNGDQAAAILTDMIEKGDAELIDGTMVVRGSMDPGQQRPPMIPRPPSAQDGRRQTMRLDQVS